MSLWERIKGIITKHWPLLLLFWMLHIALEGFLTNVMWYNLLKPVAEAVAAMA